MGGTVAQANKPGPHLLWAMMPGDLVLLAVTRGSGSFLEAAVPLTLLYAASHIKPALAVQWAWAQSPS